MTATNTFITLPYSSPLCDSMGKLTPAWTTSFANNLVPTIASLTSAANITITLTGAVSGKEGTSGEIVATLTSPVLTSLSSLPNAKGYLENDGKGNWSYSTPSTNVNLTDLSIVANNGITESITVSGTSSVLTLGLANITPISIVTGTIQGSVITATGSFSGPGTGLTGTAGSLSIGGNAATATTLLSTLPVTLGGTGTATAFTQGSIVYAGASGIYNQDNADLFYNPTGYAGSQPFLAVGPRASNPTDAAFEFYVTSGMTAHFHNVNTTQSITGGVTVGLMYVPTGAAVTSGNRVGSLEFGGSYNTANNPGTISAIRSYTTQNLTSTTLGGKLLFQTVPNGSATLATALTLDQDQTATFASTVTGTSFNSITALANAVSAVDVSGGAIGTSTRVSRQDHAHPLSTAYLAVGGTAVNSSELLGGTWAIPGSIGSTTPNTGVFSSLTIGTGSTAFQTVISPTQISLNMNGYTAGKAITINGNSTANSSLTMSVDGSGSSQTSILTFASQDYIQSDGNNNVTTWSAGGSGNDFVMSGWGSFQFNAALDVVMAGFSSPFLTFISTPSNLVASLKTATLTTSRTYTFPDKTGTVAMTSDLPSTTLTLGSTTLTLGGTTTSVAGLTLTGASLNGSLGATTPSTIAATTISATGSIDIKTAGSGLKVAEGSNAKQGVVTLVLGTATVANTSVTATSRIHLTAQSLGTITVPAALAVSARVAGTSFTILSSNLTDTSVVAYEIFEVG